MKPNLIPRFNKDFDFGDFLHSIKSIFRRENGEIASLNQIFGDKYFFFTNTGRTSLYIILRALDFPIKSKIGVPLYSCISVFDAIAKASYVPVFIDIDIDNYTLDPTDLAKKIDELSAVVVIHTFGRPADMDEIKKIAGDVPIIEDCAHSILSKYKEKQTGTLSFASYFSFKKYLSMGEGGMIILNNDELAEKFQIEINLLPSYTTINEIKSAFEIYIHSFLYHKPWFGLFSFPIGSYIRSKAIKDDLTKDFKANNIRKMHLSLLNKKLNGFGAKVELQRKNSFFLINELRETSLILPYEKINTYCNYYIFPLRFDNKIKRDKAHKMLGEMGIDTAKLFSETPLISNKCYEYEGDCINSEKVADSILIIPNYYSLTENDLIKVANSIKNVVKLL